jgi:ribokinase
MPGRVIVVGSLNTDLVVTGERLPGHGETVTGGRFARHHGGKGGNQAVAAARLGAPTAFVGAVGGDDFGAEARAALAAEGIGLDGLVTLEHEATGVALILVDARGENLISIAGGANLALSPVHVRETLARVDPREGDVVLVGHEIPTACVREALVVARKRGATTILNPAPVGGLDRSTFGLADILTPNRVELAALVAEDGRRIGRAGTSVGVEHVEIAARTLLEANAEGDGVRRAVLVTLGASGALLLTRDEPALDLPAPAVDAIDTVGAGDTFNGGLAAALAAGVPLADAARRAVAAAAMATTVAGAREGMPTSAQLEANTAARGV